MDSCENKARQIDISLGFNVPDLRITNLPESLLQFSSSQEVVVKQLFKVCVSTEDGQSAKALYSHLICLKIINNWRI